jgi:hypothetical protein
LRIKFNIVFFEISVELISPQNFGDLDQLVIVIVTVEKWLLAENLPVVLVSQFFGSPPTPTIEANMQPRLHMSRL